MNSLRIGLLLGGMFFLQVASSMEPGPGEATCKVDADNNCHIAWNLVLTPKSDYRVEGFDPKLGAWQTEQHSVSSNGVAEKPATPGRLYRVVGCNNAIGLETDCVSTSVYWSPVLPSSTDDIPSTVRDGEGRMMQVSKGLGLRSQTLQYNVYLFAQAFDKVNFKTLPKMSEPPSSPQELVDMIHANVYSSYQAYQEIAFGIAQDPNSKDP